MSGPKTLILGGQGYVGSALLASLRALPLDVQSVDLELRGGPNHAPNVCRAFQELTAEELAPYDAVVLLAGHAGVAPCDQAPAEAFANNVGGFVQLVHKLRGQKLVFASTISVYVNTDGRLAREQDPLPEPVSAYDFHKQTIERYAALAYPDHSYALRLGTVCGPSPNPRHDVLLNSMVRAALTQGQVRVSNRQHARPLLGIFDFCRAVEAILRGGVLPGPYNLASVNVRIGEAAEQVAQHFGVPCVEADLPSQYDIRVDTRKFSEATGLEFRDSVASLIEALTAAYSRASPGGVSP